MDALIEAGAPLTLMGYLVSDKFGHIYGHAIHAAVLFQKNDLLEKILTCSVEHIEDHIIPSLGSSSQNFTPLLVAISMSGDCVEIVQMLLSHGAYFDN